MASQPDPAPHPWRRLLRFSVRGLIVFVVVVGAGLGWIVRQAQIQRDAVAAITRAGGWAAYDWQWRGGKMISEGTPWAPGWLVDLIGVDYFDHVTAVGFPETSGVTDATLAHVGSLTRLQVLYVNSPSLSDAWLVHLKGLTKLSGLDLSGTHITDAGLAHLKGLIKLTNLSLFGTQVTDAGAKELKQARPSLTIQR
jgi:hypothetical protein